MHRSDSANHESLSFRTQYVGASRRSKLSGVRSTSSFPRTVDAFVRDWPVYGRVAYGALFSEFGGALGKIIGAGEAIVSDYFAMGSGNIPQIAAREVLVVQNFPVHLERQFVQPGLIGKSELRDHLSGVLFGA